MGWFNRLVIRNGTIGLGIVLKRIRFAEKAARDFEHKGHYRLAAEWDVKRSDLERHFHEMRARLDERLSREESK
jgi:hypothetical protein